MPHVIVKMSPGRSEDQKRRLAEAFAKDLIEIVSCKEASISVAIGYSAIIFGAVPGRRVPGPQQRFRDRLSAQARRQESEHRLGPQ
jgi:hypothetical protein